MRKKSSVSADDQAYTWDNKGNLLSNGQRTFTYDAANRLTSVANGVQTTQFSYNGLGEEDNNG